MILGPLREALKEFHSIGVTEKLKPKPNMKVEQALRSTIGNEGLWEMPRLQVDQFNLTLNRIENLTLWDACNYGEKRVFDIRSLAFQFRHPLVWEI